MEELKGIRSLIPGPNRQTFEEAKEATFKQYSETMKVLAGIKPREINVTKNIMRHHDCPDLDIKRLLPSKHTS